MTEETKKLFDAPWKAVEMEDTAFPYLHECEIVTNNGNGHMIATEVLRTDANRLARLPELYDALAEATRRYCGICHNLSGQDEPKIEDLVKNGCPAHAVSCVALDWLELLRKVRDGE